jgi:hypothetical protein
MGKNHDDKHDLIQYFEVVLGIEAKKKKSVFLTFQQCKNGG